MIRLATRAARSEVCWGLLDVRERFISPPSSRGAWKSEQVTSGRPVWSSDMDTVKELVRQHWNRRAANFDEEPSHGLLNDLQARAWRRLIARIAGPASLDALDIGCGTGFLSLLLAAQGHRVTGVDLALLMLAQARSKAAAQGVEIRLIADDVETLASLPAASFDLAVERHVIWTLPNPEAALQTWRRVLRPGGKVVLIEGWWSGMEPREEYAEIRDRLPLFGGQPIAELAKIVCASGFEVATAEPLMDPELWTETPQYPCYIMIAKKPER
jgi:ubiquinone/menaquinone biosynthesis C-methylase UbiE